MKNALLLLSLIVFSSIGAYANQAMNVSCTIGGQKVSLQGLQSTTYVQASYPGCTITVYLAGTTNKANIYSDNLNPPTPLANPFTATINGTGLFYAAGCVAYDVVLSGGGLSAPVTIYGIYFPCGPGDPINTSDVNGVRIVDGMVYTSIQSALTAASTTGAVFIPPVYGNDTETYNNSNNVVIADYRSNSSANNSLFKLGSQVSNLGDSIDNCNHASSNSTCATYLVSTVKGWNVSQLAVGGQALADMFDQILALNIDAHSITLMPECCINDELNAGLGTGTVPSQSTIYQQMDYAANWFLDTIPGVNKTLAINATTSAGWSVSSKYGGTVVMSTTGVGNTLTFTGQGNAVCVALLYEALSDPTPAVINTAVPNTSTATITIDGNSYGSWTTGITNRLSRNERLYAPACTPFSNLSEGTHTIVITSATGTDGSNPLEVAFASFNSIPAATSRPTFIQGNTIRACTNVGSPLNTSPHFYACSVSGYAGSNGTDAGVYARNGTMKLVAQQMKSWGLGSVLAPVQESYDPNVYGNVNSSDGLHPNDPAMADMAQAILGQLGVLMQPYDHGDGWGGLPLQTLTLGAGPATSCSTTPGLCIPQNFAIRAADSTTGTGAANFLRLNSVFPKWELATNYSGLPLNSGTQSPAILDIHGNGAISSHFGVYNSGSGAGWWQVTEDSDNSITAPLLLNPNGGNVGVGLTNPGQPLDVIGAIRSSTQLLIGSASNYVSLSGTFTSARTLIIPDASMTMAGIDKAQTFTQAQTFNAAVSTNTQLASSVATGTAPFSIASTTPVTNLTASAVAYNHSGTQITNYHTVQDTCTLGTNCAVTLTGAAVFTSSGSYKCSAWDSTTAANTVTVAISSGSAVTFTGTGTDSVVYRCEGN